MWKKFISTNHKDFSCEHFQQEKYSFKFVWKANFTEWWTEEVKLLQICDREKYQLEITFFVPWLCESVKPFNTIITTVEF